MVSKEEYLKSLTKEERKRYLDIAVKVAQRKKKVARLENNFKMIDSMIKIQGRNQKKKSLKKFVREMDSRVEENVFCKLVNIIKENE